MGDTFQFRDETLDVRLNGTLHDPEATAGDVLTVQSDGSVAAEPGGGSMPQQLDGKLVAQWDLSVPIIVDAANAEIFPNAMGALAIKNPTASPAGRGMDSMKGNGSFTSDEWPTARRINGLTCFVFPDPLIPDEYLFAGDASPRASWLDYFVVQQLDAIADLVAAWAGSSTPAFAIAVHDRGTGIAGSSLSDGGGGSGYAPGDTGLVTSGNGDATYEVLTVDGGGAVLTYSITAPGSGYAVATVIGTTLVTGDGDGAFFIDITEVTAPDLVWAVWWYLGGPALRTTDVTADTNPHVFSLAYRGTETAGLYIDGVLHEWQEADPVEWTAENMSGFVSADLWIGFDQNFGTSPTPGAFAEARVYNLLDTTDHVAVAQELTAKWATGY